MADDKSGYSRDETDWLGNEYTQHYDQDGAKVGSSSEQTDWLGDKYTQHVDNDGRPTGRSRGDSDWLGDAYQQHFDGDGEKTDYSRRDEDWLGNKYTQHYDSDDKKTGYSEREEDWLGDSYVQHHDSSARSTVERAESSSSSSGVSYGSDSGGSSDGYASSSTYSYSSFGEFLWALPAFIIIGMAVMWLYNWHNRSPANDSGAAPGTAYVTAQKLNLRTGPGTQFRSIAQLSRGESVICLEKRTDSDGTMWTRVNAGGKDGWVSEKHLTTVSPNVSASAAPPAGAILLAKMGDAPFYGNVARLAFFEAGKDTPGIESRSYATSFDASSARYLSWQLDLNFSSPGQPLNIPLKATYVGPDGVVTRQNVQLEVQANWTSSSSTCGFGNPSPGFWKPGTYRVDVMASGKLIASGSFNVGGDRPVELPKAPSAAESYPHSGPPALPEERPADNDRPILARRDQAAQRVSSGAIAGKAIRKPQPAYPSAARIAGVEGTVVVEVTIDEEGNVIAAHAVSGPAMLLDAAVNAAGRWVFAPTLLSGTPVKVTGSIVFNFKRS